MTQMGRISGPLLKDNLERNGADLAFDTDLLYLKIGPIKTGTSPFEDGDPNPTAGANGIGINTDAPTRDLSVDGAGKISDSLIVTGVAATIDNIVINTNGSISSVSGPIIIEPTGADAFVEYGKVTTTDFVIKDNYIHVTAGTDRDLILDATGNVVDFISSSKINGNLQVTQNIITVSTSVDTGNITLDGTFTIGDSPLDIVQILPDFSQSLLPGISDEYTLGSTAYNWDRIWLAGEEMFVDNININDLVISDQTSYSGNTISTLQSNEDLLVLSDTGIVSVEALSIQNNTITNLNPGALSIGHTQTGYLVFADTNAMRIPVGVDADREDNEVADTRWNTERQYLECFDGSVWQVSTGGGQVISEQVMQELSEVYAIILG